MRPVLTPEQAAALDAASAERGVSVEALMERAGWEVARAVLDVTGGGYGRRAVVVCGRGNNAGDGLVAARHLDRAGMRVSVVLVAGGADALGEPSPSNLGAVNFARLATETQVTVSEWPTNGGAEALTRELARADVAIDAIFGTGLRGAVEGAPAEAIEALNASGVPVVSVDIPSGVNGATGAISGAAVEALVTVSFGALKTGLVLYPGTANAGAIEVVDIGFPPELIDSDVGVIEASDVAPLMPVRDPDTNKRATGVVLVVGGSRDMTGAVGLAAASAYRAGAGLVTVAVPESIVPVVEAAVPEATFLPLPETDEGSIAVEAFKVLWDHLGSFDAFAVGPGLGRNEETAEFARSFVCAAPAMMVVDADALNAFTSRPEELTERDPHTAILTPHAGEFARLVGGDATAEQVATDRIASVRAMAHRTQQVVLLKGSRTTIGAHGMIPSRLDPIVMHPDGWLADRHPDPVRINATGSPALATAGSGDTLTGLIAGLLARRLTGMDAASVGAYVHGLAGIRASSSSGEGTTAGDVSAAIPRAMREAGAA